MKVNKRENTTVKGERGRMDNDQISIREQDDSLCRTYVELQATWI
jgi:hypothetical protein